MLKIFLLWLSVNTLTDYFNGQSRNVNKQYLISLFCRKTDPAQQNKTKAAEMMFEKQKCYRAINIKWDLWNIFCGWRFS